MSRHVRFTLEGRLIQTLTNYIPVRILFGVSLTTGIEINVCFSQF